MSEIRDIDLVRYAVRENIMGYFKGDAISRVVSDFRHVVLGAILLEMTSVNNRGRAFRYAQREHEISDPRQLYLSGCALAQLSKAPDTIKLNSRLVNGPSAAREVYSDIMKTVELYIPAAKLEFVELDEQEHVDNVFSDESLALMLEEHLQSIRHNSAEEPVRPRPGNGIFVGSSEYNGLVAWSEHGDWSATDLSELG